MNFLRKLFGKRSTDVADQLFAQGLQYSDAFQFPQALAVWQQALTSYRAANDLRGEEATLSNLGNVARILGEYDQAISYYQRGLELATMRGDRLWCARHLGGLAIIASSRGDLQQALEYHQQHLSVVRQAHALREEGTVLNNLGYTYYAMGQYAAAIEHVERSAEIARSTDDLEGEINAITTLGATYLASGEIAQAIASQERGIDLARQLRHPQLEAYALGNLGQALIKHGDYARAITNFERCLKLVQTISDLRGQIQALANLGFAYQVFGTLTASNAYYQQMLDMSRKANDLVFVSQALANLASNHMRVEEIDQAIVFLEESLHIKREVQDRRGEGTVLGNLGVCYLKKGDFKRTIAYEQQRLNIAQEIGDLQGQIQAHMVLGGVYEHLGVYSQSLAYNRKGLVLAQQVNEPRTVATFWWSLGDVLYQMGDLAEAEKALFASIEVREQLRSSLRNNDAYKIEMFERQLNPYRLLQKVLALQGKSDAALEVAERGRARTFVELVARRMTPLPDSLPTESANVPSADQIREIARSHQATIVEYSIVYNYAASQGVAKTVDLFIWVITSSGRITLRVIDMAPFISGPDAMLSNVASVTDPAVGTRARFGVPDSEGDQADDKELQYLYQLLIEPITDLLPVDPEAHIIFVPQGWLFFVPFPALRSADNKALIEQHTISLAPSIQLIEWTEQLHHRNQTRTTTSALVVGNPSMARLPASLVQGGASLLPLPYAEQEAIAIAALLGTEALLGEQATKAAVIARVTDARIIHLATHGVLGDDQDQGMPGAMALAPTVDDDGLLRAEEILELNLRCDLVILSACDTGRGRVTGDGVIGLSRSLITAGAPSVIISLWSVPDESTAYLMVELYKSMLDMSDKARALRHAMLRTKERYPHHRSWAGFALFGAR